MELDSEAEDQPAPDDCKAMVEENGFIIPEWLENKESLFNWFKFPRRWGLLTLPRLLKEKLKGYEDTQPEKFNYELERLSFLLSIWFISVCKKHKMLDSKEQVEREKTNVESDDQSEEDLSGSVDDDPEDIYLKCKAVVDQLAANQNDFTYARVGCALEHVLSATKAYTLYLDGNINESMKVAKEIEPVESMSRENVAGIYGIKAGFFINVCMDRRVGLEASKKAVEMDQHFSQWMYLAGLFQRCLMRKYREEVNEEHLKYFEKAIELERSPRNIVFLAQAYQEMALSYRRSYPRLRVLSDEFDQKSLDLYRECWKLNSGYPHITRRIGNGMLKMNKKFFDRVITKAALLRSLEDSPNPGIFHAVGKFYLSHEQDEEKALEYFEMCPGRYGWGEIIRHNYIKYKDYDPFPLIEKMLKYHNRNDLDGAPQVLCDIGWYYLVFKHELDQSVHFFWRCLKKDPFFVLEFQSYAFCVKSSINMLEVLVNEIMLIENEQKAPLTAGYDEQKMAYLEDFLNIMLELHPDLRQIKPYPTKIRNILSPIEKFRSTSRRSFYQTKSSSNSSVHVRETSDDPRASGSREYEQVDSKRSESKNVKQKTFKNNRYDVTFTDWRKK